VDVSWSVVNISLQVLWKPGGSKEHIDSIDQAMKFTFKCTLISSWQWLARISDFLLMIGGTNDSLMLLTEKK